jgi:glycosyltransferase involved in cell wall biosynthesis
MDELISIIVPVYNTEKYLDNCIKSIINQTHTNLQIILVDDGSTDNSGKICDGYAVEDSRITVIHQKNKGLVSARKSGINMAVGSYVGFVDSDDYIDSDMYEKLLSEIVRSKSDMVHTGYYRGDYKIVRFKGEVVRLKENRMNFLERVLVQDEIAPSIWSKLFKREIIMGTYADVDEQSSYGEDLICLCSLIFKADRISLLNKAYYHYNVRNDSMSHAIDRDGIKKEMNLYNSICKVIKPYNDNNALDGILNQYLVMHLILGLDKVNDYDFKIQKYYFPTPNAIQDKRIVIYGAGDVGKDYYSQICRYTNCIIVAWVDKYPEAHKFSHTEIKKPDVLPRLDYDLIVVAVRSELDYIDIRNELLEMDIAVGKIIWEKPKLIYGYRA